MLSKQMVTTPLFSKASAIFQVMVETLGATAWCAEVLQARAAATAARAQIAAVAALAAATDRCRDLVVVTDDQQKTLVSILDFLNM